MTDNNQFVDIRCQEPECPYGKKDCNRCKYGEANVTKLTAPLPEKHKCKIDGKEIIITLMPTVA